MRRNVCVSYPRTGIPHWCKSPAPSRRRPTVAAWCESDVASASERSAKPLEGVQSRESKGRHAFIMRLRIAASLRKSLKLPLGATYGDVIALARAAAETFSKTGAKR